ncbi:cadmium-translocating P-type ATPase [Tepiditoga spiralis]|uniref:Cadmium-translocating P-type ATPase n=1 Tax=Tepiditoga spiralis TaxID=2108365 RepID=A0A7G1GA69_9BACT|nr:heavy metal translocating P-type ATPase [Tepiditoga spiralis]BBE31957.1 cadmium-translocating P-type ATPase [Tepiditoga spiralis]
MEKQKIKLEGLDCANCASKIEKQIKELADVKSVNLNFITKIITIESKNDKFEDVESIVKKLEPHVNLYKEEEKEEKKNEIRNETIRFSIALIFFISGWFFTTQNISIYLFLISYVISGYKVIWKSIKNILNKNFFDENFLMSIATIGAISIKEFPEATGVMIFYEIGELFQSIAINKSRKSITSLMDIRPDFANKFDGEKTKIINPEELKIGDIILVKPGEKVPVDGIIFEGKTKVNTLALTGESIPKSLKENDEILSGYINESNTIKVKVSKLFSDSTVSKILEMVENASSKKAQTEKFITKFAKYYTPIVVFSAIVIAFITPIFLGNFNDWFYRGLLFLVISCPCALVVSIPLGYFAGIGALSKNGVLVKGGNYIEALKNLTKVVFDKTGTLTHGVFEVSKVVAFNVKEKNIIKFAAYAEEYSNHPIAKSIKTYYKNKININLISSHEEIPGHGVKANIDGFEIFVGNEKLMKKFNIKYDKISEFGTVIHVAINNKYSGYIVIADKIKNESKETIAKLKKLSIKTIMLTGDNEKVAKYVANELGIDYYYSELLPNDKVIKLENELNFTNTVAFVGDGINDAPVLTRADVGISMGGLGSDAAIEASDVVIMDDKIDKIITSIKISKRTSKIIWQNIIFVLLIKIVFLVLGALGIATMWEAIFADVGVALLAILNAMRINKKEVIYKI